MDSPQSHSHFGVQLLTPLAIFAGLPNDRLIVRVGSPDPITLVRSLAPNYGVLCDALANGLVMPLGSEYEAGELIAALHRLQLAEPSTSSSLPPAVPPPRWPRHRWPRHLTLVLR